MMYFRKRGLWCSVSRRGQIGKALSGFYYVNEADGGVLTCRARGKFRKEGLVPLVGDWVEVRETEPGCGMVWEIEPRRNAFLRPAVANIDQMVVIASAAIPVTDPFLIDRVTAIAALKNCDVIICINKCDLEPGDALAAIYRQAGFPVVLVSAETGEGIAALRDMLVGKLSAFTGNSGVGKSSILNAIEPGFSLQVADVSEKLGRGRHTTRHVELFPLCGGLVADTPGFSAFDVDQMEQVPKQLLPQVFRDFAPYRDGCRFVGCAHVKERDCAVRQAVADGQIAQSRYQSYLRLYEQAKERPSWESGKH